MIEPTIYSLSNEAYHFQAPYSEYLSSSQLKLYSKSPKAAKFTLDNPVKEKSAALRFGSLFHDCMAALAQGATLCEVLDAIVVFEPPTNKRTGNPFGTTTDKYKTAYNQFLESAKDAMLVATSAEKEVIRLMLDSLLQGNGATSRQVRKLLLWGKPEVSHFSEYSGCKFKWRPDLETNYKIIDWKTVSTDDLSEENINHIILKYGYHISAAYYQFFTHEQTEVWKRFILVFASKVPPYDCVMVDMSSYGYRYIPEYDVLNLGPGAMEFERLRDLHIRCANEGLWPGAENMIPADSSGNRILEIQPPKYYYSKFIDEN